ALRRKRRQRALPGRAIGPGGHRVGGLVCGRGGAVDARARAAGDSFTRRTPATPSPRRKSRGDPGQVITPRVTRLVRVADLHAFRDALVALACEGAAQ